MSILRTLFGPSKHEVWRQFSEAIGAHYVEGGFWKGGRVEGRHGEWTVTLDTYTVSNGKSSTIYTRIRAPYINPDGFRFNIHRKSIFSDLGKWMGMQDVNVGYPGFDDEFIIKGNDEQKLRRLFANERIRELITAQPAIRFSVIDDENHFWGGHGFPPNVDELRFVVRGVIRDVERLHVLFDLFAETLDELCRMGSAYENDPNVKL
ncbi:MAG TPA: hypothetical protein VK968_01045 [Roseimicrobium sp.]|nr:hypothetical protein [Roseimicrobium sp.]